MGTFPCFCDICAASCSKNTAATGVIQMNSGCQSLPEPNYITVKSRAVLVASLY